jgi:hypothetical protein
VPFYELAGRVALAMSQHMAEFEERELRLLLAYLQHLNAETLEAHMSVGTLARKAHMSQATAYRALARLKAAGWLVAGENHRLFLGSRFLTAVQAEPIGGGSLKLVSNNQPTLLEPGSPRSAAKPPAPPENLPESLAFVLGRKGVETQRLQQLVAKHGEATVLAKARELVASYPDDSRIRASFMGLLVRACEADWVFTAEVKPPVQAIAVPESAQADEPAAIAAPAAAETLVAVSPDGSRYPVTTARPDCVKVQRTRQTPRGRSYSEELAIPARHWHTQGWRFEAS